MVDWYEEMTAPAGEPATIDWYAEMTREGPKVTPSSFHGPRKVSQETEGAADIHDVGIASLASEPESQIRYYAEQMGIPEENFGVVAGQIVYMKDDGSLQAVAPGFLRGQAKGVGPSFPAVGGAVGGVSGLILGGGATAGLGAAPAALGGGAVGAGAGEQVRQGLAKLIMGEPLSGARVAEEATFDFVASVVGLLVAKGVTRALATRAGKELKVAIGKGGQKAMDALKTTLDDLNAKYGTDIKLTPAEISNAAKLRAQQMGLENRPETAQTLEDFYAGRGGEIDKAMTQYLEGVSPVAGGDTAGAALTRSADEAMAVIKAQRVAQGSPAYKEAFREAGPIDISPAFTALEMEIAKAGRPARVALQKVRREMLEPVLDDAGKPVTDAAGQKVMQTIDDLEMLQNKVKETLDDEIGAMIRAGRSKAAGALRRVQDSLLENLDAASPKYQAARAKWADLSGPVTAAEGGILPVLSRTTAKDFEYMGLKFFGKASPAEITRARTAILATEDGNEAWNAALRGFMEQSFEAAGRVFKSKIARPSLAKAAGPSAFWADMVGNPIQKRRMAAAMSPEQSVAFRNLMSVFEATGRATNYNSTTVAQQQAIRMLDATGKGAAIFRAAVNPFGIPRRAEQWLSEHATAGNLRFLTEVLTNNDSVETLLKIVNRSGARDRNILLIAKAFNLVRTSQATGFSGADRLPPAMGQPPIPFSPTVPIQ